MSNANKRRSVIMAIFLIMLGAANAALMAYQKAKTEKDRREAPHCIASSGKDNTGNVMVINGVTYRDSEADAWGCIHPK